MRTVAFTAYGNPKGQPRARAFARGGKVRMYDPGTAEGWKAIVAAAAQQFVPAKPCEGMVALDLKFWMPRPKRLSKPDRDGNPTPHLAKPDADNLAKAIMDAFTQIGMWRDDAQVADLCVMKYYHQQGERPGVTVTIAFYNDKEE